MLLANNSGGSSQKEYVDSLFSAYTYTGNGSTQTINNGIDLAGKGGLVWIKRRNCAASNILIDTVRGANKNVFSNLTNVEYTFSYLNNFTSSGYEIGPNGDVNGVSNTYVSWTFRRAPKFFDVVTYTGDGTSNRQIVHSLGIDPGFITAKATSTTGDWNSYHRSATGDLALNTTAAQTGSKAIVNSATASTFTVSGVANTNGVSYVAYLFAHDPSADGIIQCGSFTAASGADVVTTLGWEPQYILRKNISTTDAWHIVDSSRGMAATSNGCNLLYANTSAAENPGISTLQPTATGFVTKGIGTTDTYIYLAIRRPNKPPTSGTQVYNAIARTGTGAAATVTGVGFAPDLVVAKCRNVVGFSHTWFDRLRGAARYLLSQATDADTTDAASLTSFNMDGVSVGTDNVYGGINYSASANTYINHFFRRAPGFFDVVCYTGTGVARTVPHSLGVAPKLIIIKSRGLGGSEYGWVTGSAYYPSWGRYIQLNTIGAVNGSDNAGHFNVTAPTASVFTVGSWNETNGSANTYVAYLFATLPGISKVGSYTGNGSTQTINCGFSAGARFILIKRTDNTGDWYVWDSVRGIVAANDPHLSLNRTAAEVTTEDSVDPFAEGFSVVQNTATNINVTGASYIYLAIA